MNESYRKLDALKQLRARQGVLEERPRDWLTEFQAQASGSVDPADLMRAHEALVSSVARDECMRTGRAVYMPGVERACFALLSDAYRRGLSGKPFSDGCPLPRAVLLLSRSLLWAYLLGREHRS